MVPDPAIRTIDAALVADGRYLRLVTRGRRTGRPRAVVVGFVEEADGSFLVAATDPNAAWARNLLHDGHADVAIADRVLAVVAEPLEGPDHALVVRSLILRYGTPSEGLGRGPSFRLRPLRRD